MAGSDSEIEVLFSDDDDGAHIDIVRVLIDLHNNLHHIVLQRIPRVQNFIETVMDRYNEEQFRQNFRIRREVFEYLLHLMGPELQGFLVGDERVSPEKQLYIFLWYFATPDSYRSIATKFDCSLSCAWMSVYRCSCILYRRRNYFIRWPTLDEAQQQFHHTHQRTGFPQVLGAVDGTHIRVEPRRYERADYINRKGFPSIQLQIVCNSKLEFIHCFTGFPGSVHDSRVFQNSGVQDKCTPDFFYENSHILGDSAYKLQNNVIVPIRDNGHLNVEERYFNYIHSSTRMMAECAIGLLKMRWRRLLGTFPMKNFALIPFYIIVCCVLHNICLREIRDMQYPIIIPEPAINLGPSAPDQAQIAAGEQKRERLVNFISNDVPYV